MKTRIRKALIIILFLSLLFCFTSNCNALTASDIPESAIRIVANEGANDTSGAAMSVNRIIGAAITLAQVAGIFIAILLMTVWFAKVIIKRIALSKMENEDKEENEEEIEKMRENYKKFKRKGVIYACIAIALIFGSEILSITKTYKPVIYIYPEDDTVVNVSLSNPEKITCSYPKYNEPWKVLANPDGNLVDLETGRNLYSLYYEANNESPYKVEKDGFVVKGKDTAAFLEEKLEILGLNEREAEEFIIYWLPTLEANKYNYIRFAEAEEIEKNMGLDINPKPDTLIRIVMTYKPLNKPITIEEQKLNTVVREGYTVVEWGASEK